MEAASASGRGVSLAQSPFRKQWRVVSEQSVRNSTTEEMERSNLGQSDERTIYEVQQGEEPIDVVDFCSVRMEGVMGMDDGILQQRINNLRSQREEINQVEVELRAQMIAKFDIVEMQKRFDDRLKEQADVVDRLQEQLDEREQSMHDFEGKMEEKERELHAIRLDNEAAWAKEDLLREQNKELASFRRERDNIDAERAHHRQQIHDLQEHIQEKERQLLELQDQHRVAQETLIYKDEQIREAQAWMSRMQELDSTLQAELRERTEQYNQLWLGCQRQFAELERIHVQTIQQLQLELAGARGKSGTYDVESQNNPSDSSLSGPASGNHVEINGSGASNSSGGLPNGNSEHSHSLVSSGNTSTQTNHATSLPPGPTILGMPPFLPPGQVTAVHPYIIHQQLTNHPVESQLPSSHVGHYQSIPAVTSLQQWQNQQGVSEGPPMPSQNPSKSESSYSYEFAVNGQPLHPDYLSVHIGQGVDPNCQLSSNEADQTLESVEKSYYVGSDAQHSLQQISSQFQEALRLEHLNQTSEIKADESDGSNISNTDPESQDARAEKVNTVSTPLQSEQFVRALHFSETTVNSTDVAVLSETFVSSEPANGSPVGKIPESTLLDEQALLACIVRTIPSGGKIRISSTLPNRLGKMLAPLHWHDYKRKYGKLDDFVSNHPELFLIEGDHIQLREGAQGIIAATSAVAKVAAAAASSSPYSSFFPPVAVTPMAVNTGRVKKVPVSEQARVFRPPSDSTQHHVNGSGYVSGSGSLSSVKILSKSKDGLEVDGHGLLLVGTENGAHSNRSILGNPQNRVPIHARSSANYVAKPNGRSNAASLPSRR